LINVIVASYEADAAYFDNATMGRLFLLSTISGIKWMPLGILIAQASFAKVYAN